MSTGHHNGAESVIIVREAIKQGISPSRIGVTHANIDPPGLTVEQMQEVAKMGAFVEICTQSQRALTPEAEKALGARDDRIADIIKQVGATWTYGQTRAGQLPRMRDGKPNLNGIWQAVSTAHWDHEAQGGGPAPKEGILLGAVGAIPPGTAVVQGGRIPYQPWARAKREENRKNWVSLDPEVRCYLPGIPRATYLPYPFQIFQDRQRIVFAYQYSYARRVINMGQPEEAPIDTWMGWANGRWEGDTLVIDNTAFIEPPTLRPGEPAIGGWLDRTGNFHSAALRVVERYTPIDATHLRYEVTLEDPNVYTRPWTISMPLYRRLEPDVQILEFKCAEYVEEMLWGNYRRQRTD